MSLRVRCGRCGQVLEVGDEHAGRQVRCGHCQAVIQVPPGGAQAGPQSLGGVDPLQSAPGSFGSPPGVPAAPGGRDFPLAAALAVGAGVLVAVVGLVAFLVVFRGGDRAARQRPTARPRPQQHGTVQRPGRPSGTQSAPPPQGRAGTSRGTSQPGFPAGRPATPAASSPPPPTVWQVEVDPPPEDLAAWPDRAEPISLTSGRNDQLLFPSTSSRVMALTGGYSKDRFCDVWDLARMERVGRVESLEFADEPYALSPDGRFFAARTRQSSRSFQYVVGVWSVESGAPLYTIAPTKISRSTLLTFAGVERLVTVSDEYQTQIVQVWNVADGMLLLSFQMESDRRWGGSSAVSPGGRYLVKVDKTLKVFDLTEGRLAGEIRLAAGSMEWTCAAAGFSPDGAELVTLLDASGQARLVRWDMATGKAVQDKEYSTALRDVVGSWNSTAGLPIQWLPGGEGWLVASSRILGRVTGEVIWEFPSKENTVALRRALDAQRVLELQRTSSGGCRLTSVDLPLEEMGEAEEAVASGGKFIDATLPPISNPDWADVRRVSLTGAGVDWSVEPGAATLPHSLIDRPIMLGPDDVRKVLFAAPTAATAVVHHVDQAGISRTSGKVTGEMPDRLTAYNLVDGKGSNTLEVPAHSELAAVSPDGRLAALVIGEERDRLDVWSLAEGAHQVGWRPYADEEVQVRQQGYGVHTARSVTWVGFVDSERLLTLSHGGKLVLWRLAEVKADYVMDFAAVTSALLTPGHRYAAVFQGTLLRFFDPTTGEFCGDLPLPYECSGAVSADQIAFSPEGRSLAVVVPGSVVSTVLHWDLGMGQLVSEIPVVKCGAGLDWCDAEHLIVGGANSRGGESFLVDVARKAIVWRYRLQRGGRISGGPDGRQWLLTRGTTPGPTYLGAMPFSDDQTLARIASVFPRDKPPLVGPGSIVTVSVGSLSAPGVGGDAGSRIRQLLEEKLRENGCEVASGAPVRLTVSCGSVGSQTRHYERIGGSFSDSNRTFSVTTTTYEARLALVDSSGGTLWERTSRFGSGSPGFIVTVPGNEDPQEYLNRRASRSQSGVLDSFVRGARIPRLLYFQPKHDKDVPGLGTTDLDIFARFNLRATPTPHAARPPADAESSPETPPALAAGSAPGAAGGATALGTGARFVRKTYIDLLSGDDSTLEERLQWFPAARRPSIGLRFGLGVVFSGPGAPPSVGSTEELGRLTGPIGPSIVTQIEQRMFSGAFGRWPRTSPAGSLKLAMLGVAKQPELLELAEQSGLDVLVVLTVSVRAIGLGRNTEMTMRVGLVDVASGEGLWASRSLSSRRVASARQQGEDPLGELLETVLDEVDQGCRLQPMPALTAEHVQSRVAALVDGLEGSKKAARLPALVELRYYQAQSFLDPDAAARAYEQVLGDERGLELATADGPGRRELLEAWLAE